MASLTVHMPTDLREFVDTRTKKGGFRSTTEYVQHLIRQDQERETQRRLEDLFVEGVESGRAIGSARELFKRLHKLVDERPKTRRPKRIRARAARSSTRS